ncbi:hypothetical protein [Schlesneria paludicola]|uniref:hypothetical protein n=1 Tax=Schlesneria paludicola TaxID=360056 RepID=UPI00029AF736|nr:hypothetical protein [Schlesneria paludicola]
MREEFLEPLPEVRTKATLLMGNVPIPCYVVEATMCEFRVAVPGIEQYEGDPRLTLVTVNAVFPVRIIRQEAHSGGYSFRLQRLDLLEQAVPVKIPPAMRTPFLSSPLRATCVLAIIMASCVCIPTVSDEIRLLRMQGRRSQTVGWGATVSKNDSVPATAPPENRVSPNSRSGHFESDEFEDLPPIEVSMVSTMTRRRAIASRPAADDAKLSTTTDQATSAMTRGATPVQRAALLKSALEAGQSGGIQNLTCSIAPWLFGANLPVQLQEIRISDTAIRDLQQFESSLKDLSADAVHSAVSSLKRILASASTDIRQAHRVAGLAEYRVISSEDASLYFRIVQGRTELVRVLPIDFNRTESQ